MCANELEGLTSEKFKKQTKKLSQSPQFVKKYRNFQKSMFVNELESLTFVKQTNKLHFQNFLNLSKNIKII